MELKIKAFKTLKECGVETNDFTDNSYWKSQCVNVIEELEWLLGIVENFSSDEYYRTKFIEDTSISKNPRLIKGLYDKNLCDDEHLKKPLENYSDLNCAINDRMHWIINKAMSKERIVEKIVVKKISKSIDMNTMVTAIVGVFGISAAFFVGCGDKRLCGILGIATFIFGLIILNHKQLFFKEIENNTSK